MEANTLTARFDAITQDPTLEPTSFKGLGDQMIELLHSKMGVEGINYDEQGLHLLDPLIETLRPTMLADEEVFLVNALRFGSFLGEILAKLFNGAWVYNDKFNRWVVEVKLNNSDLIFFNVFHRVKGRIINGQEDSIDFYFVTNWKIISGEEKIFSK